MDIFYALLIGIGIAAATGLRVFLPLLGLALAGRLGDVPLADDMQWLLSDAALLALATATLVEIAAYYLPLVDHLLDAVTTPLALAAGTLATVAMLGGIEDPLLRWGLAVVAGAGAAGTVQAGSVVARAASTATTGGLGNPVVSTFEWIGALLLTLLALLLPVVVVLVLLVIAVRLLRRRRKQDAPGAGRET
jgi:hypothetical protein